MPVFVVLRPLRTAVLSVVLTGSLVSLAHAQPTPDAGSLQRESERSLQVPRPAERPVTTPAAQPLADDAKAARVTVKRLIIEGSHLIPAAELEASLADLEGQSLALAELEHAAQRIADIYRARGWFARVYLPQQDVTDGVIRIQVLEGHYGGSRLDDQSQRANADYVQGLVTHRLQPGQPLSAADLERGLLLANDLPGIRALGLLEAGDTVGETRVRLKVEDTPFVTGDIALNNYGIKSVGRAQLVGGVALNDLSGRGDQLSLRGLASERLWNAQARYTLPLGSDGWRLGAHYSKLDYELGKQYAALDASGTAQTAGLSLSYPLLRQARRNLYLSGGYEHHRYDDEMLDTTVRRHRIDSFNLGLSGDMRDDYGGGGITWGGLILTQGKLDIHDVAGDRALDAAGPRSHGSYSKLSVRINRQQALGVSGWQLHGNLSGQAASRNLASSERMTLGGPNGVRAYPMNEANGDEGLLLKLELQRNLGNGWQVIGFVDTGHIRQHKRTWTGWQGGGKQPNSYELSGAGIGLNWYRDGWQLAFSVASPIGHNPGRDAFGRNNDGSKVSAARGWLTVARLF